MAQNITVQIGQCGNQMGLRFWDLALREHSAYNPEGIYNESFSSYFRNVDTRYQPVLDLGLQGGTSQIHSLKARAVLIDMEEGVLGEALKSPLGEIFDTNHILSDVSGSGNNWAVGHEVYGEQYRDSILDSLRQSAEQCDALQSFFLMHSMGGGTGSGVGTFVLELLADEFPECNLFTTAVFPNSGPDDDVITSPYNSVLAMRRLTEHADCVLPVENDALLGICRKLSLVKAYDKKSNSEITTGGLSDNHNNQKNNAKPFDSMNNIIANLLLNLTSSSRFEGSLNVDLNEISMNLVPYPSLHYLLPAMSPLYTPADLGSGRFSTYKTNSSTSSGIGAASGPRQVDELFRDCFSASHQLFQGGGSGGGGKDHHQSQQTQARHHTYLACALMGRGNITVSDVRRNIEALKYGYSSAGSSSSSGAGSCHSGVELINNNVPSGTTATPKLRFPYWNSDGWKTGLCSLPPVGQKQALLTLANNCCIANAFGGIRQRFLKLYRRRAHVHHYTQNTGLGEGEFGESLESLEGLIADYESLEGSWRMPEGGGDVDGEEYYSSGK
eukprot:Nk52_evm1s1568 gene=Nk52_evmTU1s1568